jgi:hypothetical protein
MTTATETPTVVLTHEDAGAVLHGIERYLLGLGLEDSRVEDELGINSGQPNAFKIGQLGRKLTLCAEVIAGIEDMAVPLLEPCDEVLTLLVECQREAEDSVEREGRDGIHEDDLTLARARLVLLRGAVERVAARTGGEA